MTTPKKITSLKENWIFVFGSNLNGNHVGGAAKQALDIFGATEGQGEGLQGQSYALPTLDKKMKQFTDYELRGYVENLYKCAKENPTKKFLVTKVGCGIAGYSEETMKKVFKDVLDKPKNIILPAGWSVIRGYKAFEKGLKCRGFQYEMGKDFHHEGEISLCNSGFHFCKSLGNVYSYYTFGNDIVVAEIESDGDVIDEENEEKSVTNHLRIIRILGAEEASNNNGLYNIGHWNTGDWNTGDRNTGDWNTGHWNTGHWNTGHRNTGDWNTGHWNTGDWNTGDRNTGYWNTGHRNTGYWNTGHRNTGYWNTGDRNTGYFNFLTPETVLVFGKECKYETIRDAEKPSCLYFNTKEWIEFSDMTDEEKEKNPQSKTTGGYLKCYEYKEAFTKSMEKASKEEIKQIKELPNFDAEVFYQISGFRIK
jgi:hypothetical protein